MKRDSFKDPFNGNKGCYLLSSSHLLKQRLFRTPDDFVFGVNTLAILLPNSGVILIAYCLMDNHIHLLLVGKYADCLAYYDKVIHRLSLMLKERYGLSGVLKQDDLDIEAVTDDRQFKNDICYLHRNPYKARISSPLAYPWSSADCYFVLFKQRGERISSMGSMEKRIMFQTHLSIPDSYEHKDGRILNFCFVSSDKASLKFRDSVEYFDILRRYSLEAEVESAYGLHESVTFSDSELQERISTICKIELHKESITLLDRKDLLRLARLVASRYGASQKQLSRLLGLDKEILDRIL